MGRFKLKKSKPTNSKVVKTVKVQDVSVSQKSHVQQFPKKQAPQELKSLVKRPSRKQSVTKVTAPSVTPRQIIQKKPDEVYDVKSMPKEFNGRQVRHILVLGNDKSINDINFKELGDYEMIVAGVNRIFLVTEPDYLFFLDNEIQEELKSANRSLNNTTVITSRYSDLGFQNYKINHMWLHDNSKYYLALEFNPLNDNLKGSVPALIKVLNDCIYRDEYCVFYIGGVSLKWDNHASHFWKTMDYSEQSLHNKGENHYNPRFEMMYQAFNRLKKQQKKDNFIMLNINPDSRLTKLLQTVDLPQILSIMADRGYTSVDQKDEIQELPE